MTAGIVYYTNNNLDDNIMRQCQEQILKSGLPIVSVSLKPIDFGRNITVDLKPGIETMFKQILIGLENIDTDYVFLCEHDVLYHPSHFNFRPPRDDWYYYNNNIWNMRSSDGHAAKYYTVKLSQLCANRQLLIDHFKRKLKRIDETGFNRRIGFEPGCGHGDERVDTIWLKLWQSEFPNIDIRHGKNLTANEDRWKLADFKSQRKCATWGFTESDSIDGWGEGKNILKKYEK